MSSACTGWMLCWVPITLFSCIAPLLAKPCTRLFIPGLDSTTTVYPQLAGVYELQTSLLSQLVPGYPIYRHELDTLFLYYNSSQDSLLLGPLQSQGLLKVDRAYGSELTPDSDYSLNQLFVFLKWKQWDPRNRQFVVNQNLTHKRPQCVDEDYGFCSSGYLYPGNLYTESAVQIAGPRMAFFEDMYGSEVHFRLLNHVFYNLRPVYEMVIESENRTSVQRSVQWYLFHKSGKWQVGSKIGSINRTDGIILQLESNAMRPEYENGTDWYWTYHTYWTGRDTLTRAFGRLQCRRQLPHGINCETTACEHGGTCHTDSNGVSSCHCRSGYRGLKCEHRVSKCTMPFQTLPQTHVFEGTAPHYEGSLVTVFCPSGDVYYLLCQNGSWQSTRRTRHGYWQSSSRAGCVPTTTPLTITPLTISTTWSPRYNQSNAIHYDGDSTGTIMTVIITLVCVQLGFPFLCYCCISCCSSDDEHREEQLLIDEELKLETQKDSTSIQRICSGFFYLCWWAWLAFVIIYFVHYGHVPLDGSSALSATAIMAFVCLGVLYCCVFSESFCSNEYKYLTQLENEEVTAGEQITEMKAARAVITFKAECSHDETKIRHVNDSHGARVETYIERVKGAVFEENFVYTDCFDDSVDFCPPHARVTKVLVQLDIEFADDGSKRVYEEAYEAFKARHLTRDQFVDFSTKNDLPGFVKRLAVHDREYEVPTWMSSSCFCLASCCCLSWPYRLMFNSSVSSYKYRIVKKILAHPSPIVNQPQSLGDFQPPPPPPPVAAALEPHAPPLPVICLDRNPDDDTFVPVMPSDHMPSVPPPSYEEFTANPDLFGTTKPSAHESIPLSEMRL